MALALALLGLAVRVPDPEPGTWSWIAGKAVQALIGGLLVGFLEETFFRGALFAAIRRRDGLAPAVLWSSALYALLHLLKPGALPPGVPFDWAGSWAMLTGVFLDVFQWRHLDTALALMMVGVFLALVEGHRPHRLVHRPARGLGLRDPVHPAAHRWRSRLGPRLPDRGLRRDHRLAVARVDRSPVRGLLALEQTPGGARGGRIGLKADLSEAGRGGTGHRFSNGASRSAPTCGGLQPVPLRSQRRMSARWRGLTGRSSGQSQAHLDPSVGLQQAREPGLGHQGIAVDAHEQV